MKQFKFLIFVAISIILMTSCDDDMDDVTFFDVSVQLSYPSGYTATDSVEVAIGSYTGYTDEEGTVTISVPSGSYTISASETRSVNGISYNFNGSETVSVGADETVTLSLSVSESSQIIIKELYIGGCQKDDGSGYYSKDSYVILYNNSEYDAKIDTNFCFGFTFPYNSNSTNKYLDDSGDLEYANEGWIPAGQAIWHFQSSVTLGAGEQIVVVFYQAIDQTGTYSNSVDLSNSEYYVMYDTETFTNTSYYTAPSENISTSQYLDGILYGVGNAWAISNTSPGFFIFATEDMGPTAFAADESYTDYYGGSTSQVAKKVPEDWIIDAIEVFRQGYDDSNNKRFTDDIDAGSITFTSHYGYTLYRNVDTDATEAIADNDGLISYGYTYGTDDLTDGSTDDSGIDAEASLDNGARIVYKDTNNASNDFHQRAIASLKD